jgi:hypothetical protein
MADRKLSEVELAGLDLFIAKKRAEPEWVDEFADDIEAVGDVAEAVGEVVAAVGGVLFTPGSPPSSGELRQRLSLDNLIALRKRLR